MSWFKRDKEHITTDVDDRGKIPAGLWLKCNQCGEIIYRKEVENCGMVCPKCNYHFPIVPTMRIEQLFGDGEVSYLFREVKPVDSLKFVANKKYSDQLKRLSSKGKVDEGVVVVEGDLDNFPVVVCIMDFSFLGGSMGSVVGEKLARAAEKCVAEAKSLIIFSCSGGARMMEGVLSLMQMAKVSAALSLMEKKALPFISVLTHPTTGGVTASFAMLGDANIAEPGALIGFAGPRVIEQTIKSELPKGFQRSEFLLEHGMIDMVVHRSEMKKSLIRLLSYFYDNN